MIDYYVYWAKRRAEFWSRVSDKFTNKFSRRFFIVLIAITFINAVLALALMITYMVVLVVIVILLGLAVERYGKAVENMAYSNYDGDRKEVN